MKRFGPGRQLLLGLTVFLLGLGVAIVAGDESDPGQEAGGATPGESVDAYVAGRRAALEGADGTHSAVVSFTAYLDEGEAVRLVGVDVERWLVAGPGGTAESTDDVEAWRRQRAAEARREAQELNSLVPTAEDPEFVRQYERDRDRALLLAEALDAGEPVVFAVLVRASSDRLRVIAGRGDVRLVDVDVDVPRGLRPEEQVVVGQPPERP